MNVQQRKQMGMRIKQAREKKGLTQDDLADKLKLTRTSVSNYESGRALPPSDVLRALACILDVSTDYLLGIGEENKFEDEDENYAHEDIGHAIKEERLRNGLTQKELAEMVGVSQSEISKFERGLAPIPLKIAEKIADAFGMSYPTFLNEYGLFDEYIPPHFDGDVDRYLAFKKAEAEDAMRKPGYDIQTIAAHHEGEEWTPEELAEIERFKEFVRMRRRMKNQG